MDQTSHFKQCIHQHIVLNPQHIQARDWAAIADHTNLETPTAWKRVPEDNCEEFERLIKEDGLSYAFVSLLQVCRRNNVDWIYFNWTAPITGGLEVFHEHWPTIRSMDTPAAA